MRTVMWRRTLLNDFHRSQVEHRMVWRLNYLRGGQDRYDPATWERVASELQIPLHPTCGTFNKRRACLRYRWQTDDWCIMYDITRNDVLICHYLVHELAHWFLRCGHPEWFTSEEIYYYEGPISDERHRLARRVENTILGRYY